MAINLPTRKERVFHQGYFQTLEFIVLPHAERRYGHMIGQQAIDMPPVNAHAWFNRAVALTQWAMRSPHSRLIRDLAKLALEKSKQTNE